MAANAENETTMSDPRKQLDRLRARIERRRYVVDERAVADAMLTRPMMCLFLAPPDRGRGFAA
jgi:anti-sigma28 factor (negative regulator of flagellin synthesis)